MFKINLSLLSFYILIIEYKIYRTYKDVRIKCESCCKGKTYSREIKK